MPDINDLLNRLATTPITDLNIETAGFRRKLSRLGYSNILEVLGLSNCDIDRQFDINDADAIDRLKDSFERSQERFALKALEKREAPVPPSRAVADYVDSAVFRGRLKGGKEPDKCTMPKRAQNTVGRFDSSAEPMRYPAREYASLPPYPFARVLAEYERRASHEFDLLDDRQDNVVVYQVFDVFATELDDVADSFQQLFNHYRAQSKIALDLIDLFFRNIFLVYVADRARTYHEARGFWSHFFPTVFLDKSDAAMTAFKRLFYNQLERRNMPIYQHEENARHYYLTALLHGGLSESAWSDLWDSTFKRLARDIRSGRSSLHGDIDGRSILRLVSSESSGYAPPKTVYDIMKKAPVATLAPLFESAVKVAMQVDASSRGTSSYTMLTSYGLPDVALKALMRPKAVPAGVREAPHSVNRSQSRIYIALPEADLQLDLSQGQALLCWHRQQLPEFFSECRVDFYVNGKKVKSEVPVYKDGRWLLEEVGINIEPQPSYEVEIRLMEKGENKETWIEQGSLEQGFQRTKPGCFEFIREASGIFRLRRAKERITRRRTVAFILDNGLKLKAGEGMRPLETREALGGWKTTQILIYEVDPGACGAIVDERTSEEIAVWQERFRASVDKSALIGKTVEGIDLYGFIPSSEGLNTGIPRFFIEAFDGIDLLADLAITCNCDGEFVSVGRKVLWQDEEESGSTRIMISPAESNYFIEGCHVNVCTVEARQRSAGNQVVFRYRFCVIPIREFKLNRLGFYDSELQASYSFKSVQDIVVVDQSGSVSSYDEGVRYGFELPLRNEAFPCRVVSSQTGKATDVIISLAGIDISIPKLLLDRSRAGVICLPDALDLGYVGGKCRVDVGGWSQRRAVLIMLGQIPLFYKELTRPSSYGFSVFEDSGAFVPDGMRDVRGLPLRVIVYFGNEVREEVQLSSAEVIMLVCREGYGFTSWELNLDHNEGLCIVFNLPSRIDLVAEFYRLGSSSLDCSVDVPMGSEQIKIPHKVAMSLRRRRGYNMVLTPLDDFGTKLDGCSSTYYLEMDRDDNR